MKKILILALVLLTGMSAFAGEAWNNHVGVGFRIPTGMSIYEYNGNTDWKLKMPLQTGIDFTYTGVHMRTGLSVRGFMDYNLSTSNIDKINPNKDDKVIGFNFDGAIGIGWAPIRGDHLLVGFYGIAGVDYSIFPDIYVERHEKSEKKNISDSTKTVQNYAYTAFFAGGNATAIWTPTGNSFSIFGSATVAYSLPGICEISSATKTKRTKNDSDKDVYSDEYYTTGALKVIPTVGVSWRF